MLELFDESVAPHYMMGRKPGMFPSFSDAYAEGEGYPHPVPFDLFDPFGSLRKMMDTEEKRARGRLVEINSQAAHLMSAYTAAPVEALRSGVFSPPASERLASSYTPARLQAPS